MVSLLESDKPSEILLRSLRLLELQLASAMLPELPNVSTLSRVSVSLQVTIPDPALAISIYPSSSGHRVLACSKTESHRALQGN